MRRYVRIVGLGVVLWLAVFLVSLVAFPLREPNRPFFETVMPVALVLATVLVSVRYFRRLDGDFLRGGLVAGVAWLAMGVAIDLPLFSWGPMRTSLVGYLQDVGLTYLVIPTVTVGIGYLLEAERRGSTAGRE